MKIENLSIDNVYPFINDQIEGFVIQWSANIGYGEYTFYKQDGEWFADSEFMDSNKSKKFGKMLLNAFLNKVTID